MIELFWLATVPALLVAQYLEIYTISASKSDFEEWANKQ